VLELNKKHRANEALHSICTSGITRSIYRLNLASTLITDRGKPVDNFISQNTKAVLTSLRAFGALIKWNIGEKSQLERMSPTHRSWCGGILSQCARIEEIIGSMCARYH